MISLKDSWHEQRRRRQQEVAQRQQQIQQTLEQFHKERHARATELREDLRLFQLELQLDTQDLLTQHRLQRQTQAEHLTHQLRGFAQALQEQIAQIIAVNAADRTAKAQQLVQELSEFHANLCTSVALLRQDAQQKMRSIQAEVRLLQAETHQQLQAHQQERIQNQMQRMQDLSSWVETLQLTVHNYLMELESERFDRAQQLQLMLQHDRDRRTVEINALFQELARFRAELKAYCIDLQQTVWGEAIGSNQKSKAAEQQEGRENRKQGGKGFIPQQSIHSLPRLSKSSPHPPLARAKSPQKNQEHEGLKPPTSSLKPSLSLPPTDRPLPKAPLQDSTQIEKDVYHQIYQMQGARLTEIEAALSLNRFQAVDALRSLIKKGVVTQRDRIYLIQEFD